MVSLVSISYDQRSAVTAVGVPNTDRCRRPERLCTGLVDARSVHLPWPASHKAAAPARVVFPTPPFPPKKRYLSFGCASKDPLMEVLIRVISNCRIVARQVAGSS